jgi:hypothetical protein
MRTTGLDFATNRTSSEQQQQAQHLQQLASSQHMLQQQLLALTNHVDPAAAAQLAAAAAGDESALTFQPLGPLGPSGCGSLSLSLEACHASLHGACGWHEAWATGSYLQAGSSPGGWQGPSQGASAAGAAAASAAGAAAPAAAAGDQVAGQQQGAVGDPVGSGNGCKSASGSRVAAAGREFGDRMGAVLRHLPVAVRLLRLEGAVRELQGTAVQEVPAGERGHRRRL